MSFKTDSLAVTLDRVYAHYKSLFAPLSRTPRENLLKVMASVEAGIYYQLMGDLDFLARQLFPDTAEGAYLRAHWSNRVTPLYAQAAGGNVILSGTPLSAVPAGIVLKSVSGETYCTKSAVRISADGTATVRVDAQNTGLATNLAAGEKLTFSSAVPAGIAPEAEVAADGIDGGADAETDEEYLSRVLNDLQNPSRYGKTGDFASWALNSSAEVSGAWEFKNFGVFGALLILVINGDQINGVRPVGALETVRAYLDSVAPPVLYEVRSPAIIPLNPGVSLLEREDTQQNRELVTSRMQSFLQIVSQPGAQITAGALRSAIIDGVAITDAAVSLAGSTAGAVQTTILEYPYIGVVSWE